MSAITNVNNPIRLINLSLLEFDPENPRLPQNIDGNNEKEVITYLIDEANIPELMMSIGEQGYFDGEPLLVVERDDHYIVVEGNRRLCALKLLDSNQAAPRSAKKIEEIRRTSPNKPRDIPCQVFSNRDDILSYLGYRHITGVNQWDALAKARYLDQLYAKFSQSHPSLSPLELHQKLAKVIASKSDYVAKLLTSLNILRYADDNKILKRIKKEQDEIPFSLITTALGYPNLRKYIGVDIRDQSLSAVKEVELDNFFEWTFGIGDSKSKLGESRNFDKLNRIVDHELALQKFTDGANIDEADIFTEGPIETLRTLLNKAKNDLENAQGVLSLVSDFEFHDLEIALQLRNLATQIHSSIKVRSEED
ncbi:ParB/Srx family N-terminal domain-containing protein [Acinetobacter towneri]|uniref:ParB/Srx family N-terminal domain-containing protein n=1 Tax=Acinetobacter towneri TaxID=202956 RepID=UPI00209AB3EF|nr:ParB/Srx family N-terminal domain-containing protein [Acinetobacter towneri]MCO8056073.1 ParB/Srx family N-terminal domain-containing protein [Acinetobacter towneri]